MSAERDNPYELLGVEPTATQAQVRRAFRLRLVIWHRERVLEIADRIAELKRAYATLKDPVQRKQYDLERRERRNSTTPPASDTNRRHDREVALRRRMAREISLQSLTLGAAAVRENAETMRLLASEHEQLERSTARRLARRARLERMARVLLCALLVAVTIFFLQRLRGRG